MRDDGTDLGIAVVLLEDRHLERLGMETKGGSQLVHSHEELEELLQKIEQMRLEETQTHQDSTCPPDSPNTSQLLLDRFQKNSSSSIIERDNYLSPVFVPGGSASNTIKNMSMLGAKCGCIGKVGNDQLGEFYKRSMRERGVIPLNTTSLTTRTGQVLCLVTPDGDRTMRAYLGASEEMAVSDLVEQDFEGVKLFHVEGYAIYSKDVVIRAMKLAKKCNATVSFDLGSFQLVRQFKPLLLELLRRYVDIVFCNESEARELIDGTPEECVDYLASICKVSVVTMGPSFCFVKSGTNKYRCPTEPVKAVDTTGAGDCFASGFLYGYLQGYSLEQCARLGSLAGGTVVQHIGAEIPINKWNELKQVVARAIYVSHRSSQNTTTGSFSLPTSFKRESFLLHVTDDVSDIQQQQHFHDQMVGQINDTNAAQSEEDVFMDSSNDGPAKINVEANEDKLDNHENSEEKEEEDELEFEDIHYDSSQPSSRTTSPTSPISARCFGHENDNRGRNLLQYGGRSSRSKSGGSIHAFAPVIRSNTSRSSSRRTKKMK